MMNIISLDLQLFIPSNIFLFPRRLRRMLFQNWMVKLYDGRQKNVYGYEIFFLSISVRQNLTFVCQHTHVYILVCRRLVDSPTNVNYFALCTPKFVSYTLLQTNLRIMFSLTKKSSEQDRKYFFLQLLINKVYNFVISSEML